ncbi:MAG: asparagine synthase (glutamine-hydrolyzing) [Leptolyngbya sp.]|nr:asparagine synthase (glutamine-hydrolyzing) [Candidatus Melainabacteria bacterium]
MCGIAGFYRPDIANDDFPKQIIDMLSRIRHRGPDESGYFFDEEVSIGSVRLSIIDLHTGSQPMSDSTGRYWIAYNGEVYNYKELKAQLKALGHKFSSESDTEVVLISFIEWGPSAFAKFNGGYGVAIYDTVAKELTVARDRYGKRPIYYARRNQTVAFASEMKAFANFPGIDFQWDEEQVASIFAYWTPIDSQTGFKDIQQLPPASYLQINNREVSVHQYADLRLDVEPFTGSESEAIEITREKIRESVELRLQSDVEVGVYLSGGLDSSITSMLAKELNNQAVRSFSVTFTDQNFDETSYQEETSAHLGTQHTSLRVSHEEIARDFPHAVYHSEVPLFRTALVPLYTLSKLVRDHGVKVVLTGEGSDEGFLGYDIFKETNLLDKWAGGIEDDEKQRLLTGLYPYVKHYNADNMRAISATYNRYAQPNAAEYFGHSIRFANSRLALKFLKTDYDPRAYFSDFISSKSDEYSGLRPIAKSQWIEFKTLLAGYLLSSQGDRMALANGVENRCPFLDPNVLAWAFSLPEDYRLKNGSDEKSILKKAFADKLPQSVLTRSKQPYLAPDAEVFLGEHRPDYVESILSLDELKKIDFLDAEFCQKFVSKVHKDDISSISPRDNQAFLLLLSVSLLDRYFVKLQHPEMNSSFKLDNVVVAFDGRKKASAV